MDRSLFCWPQLSTVFIWISYVAFLALQMRFLPGKLVQGQPLPPSFKKRLTYKINGLLSGFVTLFSILLLIKLDIISPSLVYDRLGEFFVVINLYVIVLVTLHVALGYRANDGYSSGNILKDIWYGTSLNPRYFGIDWKMFAYRPGMFTVLIINLSTLYKQFEIYLKTSMSMILYQLFMGWYVVDYLIFEHYALCVYDIIEERFGFMLIWGDYVWIPFVFSLQSQYLIHSTIDQELSMSSAVLIMLMYIAGYAIFRGANRQKSLFRENPSRPIWGRMPKTLDGKLLVSGWWGIGRKINYTGDLLMAWAMCLPCGTSSVVPYLYAIYLTCLLIQRAHRDEHRCARKYGKLWTEYCQVVPYRMVPYCY